MTNKKIIWLLNNFFFNSSFLRWLCRMCHVTVRWPVFKGSSGLSHLIFEINVGKRRIRHRKSLKLNFLTNSKSIEIQSRFMSDPPLASLISKIKWCRSGLPLKIRKAFIFGINSAQNPPKSWNFAISKSKVEMMISGTKPRKAPSKTIYSSYKSKRQPKPKFDYVL